MPHMTIERHIKTAPQKGERARAMHHAHHLTIEGLTMWLPREAARVQMTDHDYESAIIDIELARLTLALTLDPKSDNF